MECNVGYDADECLNFFRKKNKSFDVKTLMLTDSVDSLTSGDLVHNRFCD